MAGGLRATDSLPVPYLSAGPDGRDHEPKQQKRADRGQMPMIGAFKHRQRSAISGGPKTTLNLARPQKRRERQL
jgi:hypothetical protein